MAVKKKQIKRTRKRLQRTLKDLGVIEKDVAKVRANLRRFLAGDPVMHSESFKRKK